MRWLRWAHRYVGAAIAALMLVLAVSGGVLIFKEEIWRLRMPSLSEPLPELEAGDHAAAFQAIQSRFGQSLRMVRLPREGMAAYHAYLAGGEALIDPIGHGLIDQWAWHETFTGILAELHFHLAAGKTGKNIIGVLGIAGGLMALSGFLLWWGVRRQFRWRSLRPERLGRAHLMRLHRDLGALTGILVVLMGLTGAALVFGSASRALLGVLLFSPSGKAPVPIIRVTAPVGAPDRQMLLSAQSVLPAGTLVSWSPPPPGSAAHYLRYRMPGEVHPNGRSTIHIDGASGRIIRVTDAREAARADKVMHWMYPLHAAKVGGWPYRVLAVLAALALAVVSLSGLWSFVQWLRRKFAG